MKFSKWYFATRCVLCMLFGIVAAWAGVDFITPRGWPLLAVFVAVGFVDGVHEVCAVRRAYKKGREDLTSWILNTGMLNNRKNK